MSVDNCRIVINTERVAFGDVFFCFPDAEKYLTISILDKASKVFCEVGFFKRIKGEILSKIDNYLDKIVEIDNLKKELVRQLKIRYNQVDNIVAITGTKGKTSTAWFVAQMLCLSKLDCGYIGTIGVFFFKKGKAEKINQGYTLTTPDIDELYYNIVLLRRKGAKAVVIEVSSHALKQGRVDGLKICCGCFTNISQDHLDYHKTMEDYFLSKSLLFSKYLDSNGVCVLNNDDKKAPELNVICNKHGLCVKTFGKKNRNKKKNDINITSISQLSNGQKVLFEAKGCEYSFCTNILGTFQIYNIVEAIAVCHFYFKKKYKTLCNILPKINAPLGRMQRIEDTNIFVDFAHTPKSLEEGIKMLKTKYGKVAVVFGCGGDRDKQKRPIMCEIAIKTADFVVITSDNQRTENPMNIINDITCYVTKDSDNNLFHDEFVKNEIVKIDNLYKKNKFCELKIIQDRFEAISFAIQEFFFKKKYAILIAGKGHEDYQIIGTKKVHFSDSEVVESLIKKKHVN